MSEQFVKVKGESKTYALNVNRIIAISQENDGVYYAYIDNFFVGIENKSVCALKITYEEAVRIASCLSRGVNFG